MVKYTHSIATYPKEFSGIAISKDRFCLQFKEMNSTLRVDLQNPKDVLKLPMASKCIPMSTEGTEFNILAVRCNEDLIIKLQNELINKYVEYMALFPSEKMSRFLKDLELSITYINNKEG